MNRRRDARERVLQALYAHELGGGDVDHVIKTLIRPQLKDQPVALDFAINLLARSLDHAEEANRYIADHAKNWAVGRIAVIDRLLLRMAIVEFLKFEDIPPKVSINESIEIAKRYSTAQSGKFINGILDAVLEDLKKEGVLHKTGRGMIGSTPGKPPSVEVTEVE